MDEATKYLIGQGVLGICFFLSLIALRRLWIENKSLTDRLEAKADKHGDLNREMAKQVTEAFQAAMRSNEKAQDERRRLLEERGFEERPRRRTSAVKPPGGADE